MLWDVASALIRSVVFIGRLCLDAHALSSNLTSNFDTEAAPVLQLLGGAKQIKDSHDELKSSFDGVADSIRSAKDAKERLFLANRAECTEITERVALIQGTIDTLKAQYESKAKASGSNTTSASSSSSAAASSSLPTDVQSHYDSLVSALSAVAVLLSSQVMPAKKKSWLKKQQWILKQANKRDETRAAFAAHAAKIGAAMDGLGLALQVQLNGAVMQMSADSAVNSAAALTRSDLLEWQQMHAVDIEAERATWTQTQRDEIAVGFNGLLQRLEESAQKQAEAMQRGLEAAAKTVRDGFAATGAKLDSQVDQLRETQRKLDHAARKADDAQSQLESISQSVLDGRASAERKLDGADRKLDAAALSLARVDRKIDAEAKANHDGFAMNIKQNDELKAMMQAMQEQLTIIATGPTSPASPSSAERPQWKYSFLELSLADLRIDFDDDRCCVGEGAMGEVWIGEWTPNLLSRSGSGLGSSVGPSSPQHGRPLSIAFKMLRLPRGTSDARRMDLVRQLKREGSLMWLLNGHPNTVQLYGAVTAGKKIGLAFELCNAGTLQSHLYAIQTDEQPGLSSYRPVSGAAALSAAQQLSAVSSLLQAIGFAHAKGVVHRDLKSENVLVHDFHHSDQSRAASQAASSQSASSSSSVSSPVSPSSSPLLSFKLSDFGSARALGQFSGLSAFASSMGGVGQSGGTLRWTPPELLSARWHELSETDRRAAENSFAVDIYALGLVIGEIFLRQPPFAQLGPRCKDQQLTNAIVAAASAPFDWSKIEVIAPKLAQLIRACCHRNPNKRPSIAELSYGLWPETMQQILSRAPPIAAQTVAVAPAAPVARSPASTTTVAHSPASTTTVAQFLVIATPSPVPTFNAMRRQIQSALLVLRDASSDTRALEKACAEIRSLTAPPAHPCNRDFTVTVVSFVMEQGGVDLLVGLLQRSLDRPAAAAAALFTAASTIARTLFAVNALPSLVPALKDPRVMIIEVCHTISNLYLPAAVSGPTRAGGEGRAAIVAIFSVLDQHMRDAQVVIAACAALRSLSLHAANEQTLLDAGMIPRVLRGLQLHSADSHVAEAACRALAGISLRKSSRARSGIDSQPSVYELLLRVLSVHAQVQGVVAAMVDLLSNVHRDDSVQPNVVALIRLGAIEQLTKLRTLYSTRPNIEPALANLIAILERERGKAH